MRKARRRLIGLALLAGILSGIAGCGAGDPGKAADQTQLRVTERDFHISAPKRVAPGRVLLSVQNRGPDAHELIVIRQRGSELPMRADGLTVDEDALEAETAGALEPADPGVHQVSMRLAPGRYELLCNMSGHYLGGMHTGLVVG